MGFNREMWYTKVYPIGKREDNSSLDGVIKCDQIKGSGEDITRVFLVKCSKCNEEVEGATNYCGNCGAKWNDNEAYFSF